jgi:hypothetical protein
LPVKLLLLDALCGEIVRLSWFAEDFVGVATAAVVPAEVADPKEV